MKLKLYTVDAFASTPFTGNPAAVCPLEAWLDDDRMQAIAAQNNLAETVFFVPTGENQYHIRWFTPAVEVRLCGHATLASAFVIKSILGTDTDTITFQSKSGPLGVDCDGDTYTLDFPSQEASPCSDTEAVINAIGANPTTFLKAAYNLMVFNSEQIIANIQPDLAQLKKLRNGPVIITAPGDEVDFVSRFFAPADGIDEDPVTGSAHCILTPYWSKRLKKAKLTARQISPRGGDLVCEQAGDRVKISGKARLYSEATIHI